MIRNFSAGEEFTLEEYGKLSGKRGYEINTKRFFNGIMLTFKIGNISASFSPINAESIYMDITNDKLLFTHHIADTEVEVDLEPLLSKDVSITYNRSDKYIHVDVNFLIPKMLKLYSIDKNILSNMIEY